MFNVAAKVYACTVLKAAGLIGQMPYCQRPPITHTMEGVNRPNLRGGGAPFIDIGEE